MKSRNAVSRPKTSDRPSRPQECDAELVIDFDRYVPTALSGLVAKLRANANAFFPQAYGVSLAEWRVLSFLREHEPASAYDIWTNAQIDKAVVSHATKSLEKKSLIALTPVKGSARKRTEIRLTNLGKGLLDRSLGEIARRHENLTAGLDAKALEAFFRVLKHIEHRIPHMGDPSGNALPAHAPIKRLDGRKP